VTSFDRVKFAELATQLAFFAEGHEALGLDAPAAADWANHGFTPREAEDWIAEGVPGPRVVVVQPGEVRVRAPARLHPC
jgi:hypothetical protein